MLIKACVDKEGWQNADWVLPALSGAVTCGSKWDICPHHVGWFWGLLCQGESSHSSPWVILTSAQGVSFRISLQDVICYQWNILGRAEKCQSRGKESNARNCPERNSPGSWAGLTAWTVHSAPWFTLGCSWGEVGTCLHLISTLMRIGLHQVAVRLIWVRPDLNHKPQNRPVLVPGWAREFVR